MGRRADRIGGQDQLPGHLMVRQALAEQSHDAELQQRFIGIAEELKGKEATIVEELNGAQGNPQDIGGYFRPDPVKAESAMRPSPTLNRIIDSI